MFAVGDDDQSIYAFRGADVGNMRDFEREFKVANVIRLEQNYRSHGNILDAANAIIKNNANRLGKNLWTEAGAGEPIRVFEAYSDLDEARWIVEEIKALVRDGHARAEIALLYRSNAQSRVLEHALFSAGLPYRVYGGLRFFERAGDQACARLPAPDRQCRRRHRLRPGGEFPDARHRRAQPRNFAGRRQGGRLQPVRRDSALSGKAGASLAAFAALIGRLREMAHLPLPELVDHVVELSGLRSHYQTEKEGQDRLANLDELVNAATSFIAEDNRMCRICHRLVWIPES